MDPRPVERITAMLYAMTRQAPGGLIQQAIAAIENALVDVKARALGVPVAELLCGPVRERLRLYWSHCGSYRLEPCRDHGHGRRSARSPTCVRLAQEVREQGFTRAQDQHLLLRSRRALHAPAGLRPQRRLARAQRRPSPPAHHQRPDGGVSRGRRRRTSTCCSTSTSTSRPRAISRSPGRSSRIGLMWLEIDSLRPAGAGR